MEKILLVGNDDEPRYLLDQMLNSNGCYVRKANDGKTLWMALAEEPFDIIILDVTLAGEDSLALLKRLTMGEERKGIPVILLTTHGDVTACIVGLELGADDSLTKPYNPRELLARIRSVLRRSRKHTPESSMKDVALCHFSGWTLQVNAQCLVAPDGVEIVLSRGEFTLLMLFLKHPNEILDRDKIMAVHRGRDIGLDERSVDTLVGRLRKRLREKSRDYRLLRTVWGRGYQFYGEVTWQ